MNERVRPELWPHSDLPVRELIAVNTGDIILVDGDYDGEYLAQYTWRVTPLGYVQNGSGSQRAGHTQYLARLALGLHDPRLVVTYRNHNPLDCRSANLVAITHTQRAAMRPIGSGHIGSKWHGYKGVVEYAPLGGITRYYPKIRGLKIGDGGGYDTPEEAARAWDKAALELYGDYAQLNFPRDAK